MAALPKDSVAADLEQKRLCLIRVQGWPVRRNMPVVHHSQKYVSRSLVTFLNEMQSYLEASAEPRLNNDRERRCDICQ